MENCWQEDPNKRPTIDQLVKNLEAAVPETRNGNYALAEFSHPSFEGVVFPPKEDFETRYQPLSRLEQGVYQKGLVSLSSVSSSSSRPTNQHRNGSNSILCSTTSTSSSPVTSLDGRQSREQIKSRGKLRHKIRGRGSQHELQAKGWKTRGSRRDENRREVDREHRKERSSKRRGLPTTSSAREA
mmetsp:Transcript_34649/g.83842  ORF Transcript_34649/g.83842 Transcript_34649/m.83842 type:complete len:185 (-) Transcript_34649:208-762(-)